MLRTNICICSRFANSCPNWHNSRLAGAVCVSRCLAVLFSGFRLFFISTAVSFPLFRLAGSTGVAFDTLVIFTSIAFSHVKSGQAMQHRYQLLPASIRGQHGMRHGAGANQFKCSCRLQRSIPRRTLAQHYCGARSHVQVPSPTEKYRNMQCCAGPNVSGHLCMSADQAVCMSQSSGLPVQKHCDTVKLCADVPVDHRCCRESCCTKQMVKTSSDYLLLLGPQMHVEFIQGHLA